MLTEEIPRNYLVQGKSRLIIVGSASLLPVLEVFCHLLPFFSFVFKPLEEFTLFENTHPINLCNPHSNLRPYVLPLPSCSLLWHPLEDARITITTGTIRW